MFNKEIKNKGGYAMFNKERRNYLKKRAKSSADVLQKNGKFGCILDEFFYTCHVLEINPEESRDIFLEEVKKRLSSLIDKKSGVFKVFERVRRCESIAPQN